MSPIHLDLETLSLVLVLVALFLTLVVTFVWLTQKTYSGFGFWVISNIAVAAGILLLGFGGAWTDILGTSLTFGAVLIGYEGNRRFLKLKNTLFFSLSIFVLQVVGLFCFKFFGDNNVVLQLTSTSLLVGIISGICGFLFIKYSTGEMHFSNRFTGITYFIFALMMILRSAMTFFTGDKNEFYKPDGIQPVFFLFYILFEIVWSFNYINLNTNRLYKELEQTQIELEKLATTDFLTGINNSRRFFEIGENEIQRAKRFRHSLSVMMFDIDFFKSVNDRYGHAAGDKVLTEVAETCQSILRGTDTFGRLGGEEFAVLLPHTDIHGAKTLAEFMRKAIEEMRVNYSSEEVRITASFGITELRGTDSQIKIVLDRADQMLYEAKGKGRNIVISDVGSNKYKGLAVV